MLFSWKIKKFSSKGCKKYIQIKKKCLKQKYEYNEFLVQIQMLLNELGTGLISEESKHMHIRQQDLDQQHLMVFFLALGST